MTYCQHAGARCQRTDTILVRIFGAGDRHICPEHLDTLIALGVDFRVLEPVEPRTFTAKDFTGTVAA